jgi:glycerol-3-phosphate acyltransferase PlsX
MHPAIEPGMAGRGELMSDQKVYTIAVDAMGGDNVPAEPVEGAVLAARAGGVRILLVGDLDAVQAELAKHDVTGLPIEVVASEGVVREGEHPAMALRRNPKVSVAVTVGLVKAGKADAAVSMGSTGATMAASVLALGLFPGLDRPTLGGPFIGLAPRTTIIDLGANVDCKPAQLVDFGALGAAFAAWYFQLKRPRVGLLSVGSEQGKGNKQAQEAYGLLAASGLNFVGNIEGHEVFADKADVLVCDGFVGNVLLKYTEGLAHAAAHYLSEAQGPDSKAVQQIEGLANAAEGAGGPLLGINGVVLAGHGRSRGPAIAGAIKLAAQVTEGGLVERMRQELAEARSQAGTEVTGG